MSRRGKGDLENPQSASRSRNIPPNLYKYSGVNGPRREWMHNLIVGSKAYFAPPSAFNDPLDCRATLDLNSSELKIRQHWREYCKRNFPDYTAPQRRAEIERMLRQSRTPHGKRRFQNIFGEYVDQNGMLCFSTEPDNMLMWSYYAEAHTGICVRFNMSPECLVLMPHEHTIFAVKYSISFPTLKFYEHNMLDKYDAQKFVEVVFGTKAKAWEHEYEWRFVLVGQVGSVRIPLTMIDGVILGLRTSQEDEAKLRNWISERKEPLELLRVQHKPDSFELELVPA